MILPVNNVHTIFLPIQYCNFVTNFTFLLYTAAETEYWNSIYILISYIIWFTKTISPKELFKINSSLCSSHASSP